MALFTDGLICDQESLREYESSILDVARTEGMELTPKLRVAQREIGFDIAAFLQRNGSRYLSPDLELTNVAISETLRHWHAVHSLSVVYRDAYFAHLNDRFREKWAQYSLLAKEAKRRCFTAGIGIVSSPLARPDAPAWDLVQGEAPASRRYLIAVAIENGEAASAASSPVTAEADPGTLVRVQLGQLPTDSRWVVYAGTADGRLVRQTTISLPGGSVWTEAACGVATVGDAPSNGQRPDVVVRLVNLMDRG
jgi:hypothetical protein